MKVMSFLLFFIIVHCKGFREDYFLDNDEQNAKEQTENTTVSITVHDEQTLKSLDLPNTMKVLTANMAAYANGSYNNKYDNDKDSDIDVNLTDIKVAAGRRIYNSEYIDKNDVLYDSLQQNESNAAKANTRPDLLKVYETFDEPTAMHKALRNQDDEIQIDLNSSDTADDWNISGEDKEARERILVDFYNLQPAESKSTTEKEMLQLFSMQSYKNSSIWYVPENLACWELPILYGELGQIRKNTDVFLTFGGKLKNVIEKDHDEKLASKRDSIPVSQALNKWCASGPCYGDHTLCLFPDLVNSKLCVNNYKVSSPTMVDRVGLVNTVNSMRNRVASKAADLYKDLPTAANMKQMIYDFDLEIMAEAWLHQCLPGPSACSSLDGSYVAQLECTKYIDYCCTQSYENLAGPKCIPQHECFIEPIIGCIHTWFRSAVNELTATDVECGHITPGTYHTVQLLWAETNKIGCAYGKSPWGDVRVVCNFAPGAPFSINIKSFCGFISQKEMIEVFTENITSPDFLAQLGIFLQPVKSNKIADHGFLGHEFNYSLRFTDVDILSKVYQRGWIRKQLATYGNGTIGLIARLVTKYTFGDESGPQCDSSRHIYEPGEPGSLCAEKGRRFDALCYEFRDPTPGYRLVAVLAPVALFTLILYDLFSGVVRQTNY